MDNKKNPVLLVSAIFGALFVVGHVVLWVIVIRFIVASDVGFLEGIQNISSMPNFWTYLLILILTLTTIAAFDANKISWRKDSVKLMLVSGILNVFH